MIKRISFRVAADRLGLSIKDLLYAAISGEIKVYVATPGGDAEAPKDALIYAMWNDFNSWSEDRYDESSEVPGLMEPDQRIPLGVLFFYESDIFSHVRASMAPSVRSAGEISATTARGSRKSAVRVGQRANSENRRQAIRDVAVELLKSVDGEDYIKPCGKPNIAALARHIRMNQGKHPSLTNYAITGRIAEKALTNLPVPRAD